MEAQRRVAQLRKGEPTLLPPRPQRAASVAASANTLAPRAHKLHLAAAEAVAARNKQGLRRAIEERAAVGRKGAARGLRAARRRLCAAR